MIPQTSAFSPLASQVSASFSPKPKVVVGETVNEMISGFDWFGRVAVAAGRASVGDAMVGDAVGLGIVFVGAGLGVDVLGSAVGSCVGTMGVELEHPARNPNRIAAKTIVTV